MRCFCYGSSSELSEALTSRQTQLDNKEPDTAERDNGDSGSPIMKRFTFQDLADATKNFSPECLVDEGSFGNFHRGKLRETGEIIAIKQLDRNGSRESRETKNETNTAVRANNDSGPPITKCFTFRELADVTKNFSPECLVGVGSYGNVYRGKLRETGEIIAIEQLDRNGSRGNSDFNVHLMTLSLLNHPNLIKLIGYSAEGNNWFLVHEYLLLGSLDQLLHDRSSKQKIPLDWYSRMKIALGTARALEYMHYKANPPVIYRNLKPSNILLDNDLNAKLSDFGLSKLGPTNDKENLSARVRGTCGYIPPEYYKTGLLTLKADVYCFGVVLLELVTGRRAVDITKRAKYQNLIGWAHQILNKPKKLSKFADPVLQGNFPAKRFNQVLVVAAECLREEQTARPTMSEVVRAITYLSSDNPTGNIKSPPA